MAKTIYTYLHNGDLNGSRAVYIGNCFCMLFKSQKEQIKEKKRDYENTKHWNLDAEYLEPLKGFLENNLL